MIEWLESAERPLAPIDASRLRRASAEFRGGMAERALSTIDGGDRRTDLSPAAHALRSDILATLGRPEEALAAALHAWKARSGRTDLSLRLATRLIEADRPGEAVAVLLEALEVPAAAEKILAGVAALNLDPADLGLLYAATRAAFLRLPASAEKRAATGFVEPVQTREQILATMRKHVASWSGLRRTPESLVVGRNATGIRPKLFWICQMESEVAKIASALGNDRPVYGMRSGHLIIGYVHSEVVSLASSYAREIEELQPEGPIRIGGNCQGAFLARATALELRKAGREVARLILMEESTFHAYDAPVELIFGRESGFNPYRNGERPESKLASAYPAGYTVAFIDGAHGEFFDDRNIANLTEALEKILST